MNWKLFLRVVMTRIAINIIANSLTYAKKQKTKTFQSAKQTKQTIWTYKTPIMHFNGAIYINAKLHIQNHYAHIPGSAETYKCLKERLNLQNINTTK